MHTKDYICIVLGEASELLDNMEVESWNVNYIISDLYNYNPKNKSQTAIERIRRVPDPRAVNPLLKAMKKSKKHHDLILSALWAYVSTHKDYMELAMKKQFHWQLNMHLFIYAYNHIQKTLQQFHLTISRFNRASTRVCKFHS